MTKEVESSHRQKLQETQVAGISCESYESSSGGKDKNDLWDDDFDDSYLAELCDEAVPNLATSYVKLEGSVNLKDESIFGEKEDVWGSDDDGWDNELASSLAEIEKKDFAINAPPSQRRVIVGKKKEILYESDEESCSKIVTKSSNKKETNTPTLKRNFKSQQTKDQMEQNRKKRLKMLLS